MGIFAKIVAIQVQANSRSRHIFVAPKPKAVVEARIPSSLVDVERNVIVYPRCCYIAGMRTDDIPSCIREIPRD